MSQNSTELLSPAQTKAMAALLSGKSVTAAAEAAGVGRETLHRWLREDPAFQAAVGSGKAELLDAARAELRAMASEAVGTLRDLMSPNAPPAIRLKAASAILEMLGADQPEPVGPTTIEEAEAANKQRDFLDALSPFG
jgi:hypothetical protein